MMSRNDDNDSIQGNSLFGYFKSTGESDDELSFVPLPLNHDVVCSKDKKWWSHRGNAIYRSELLSITEEYREAVKNERKKITKIFLQHLKDKYGCRFLRYNKIENNWTIITDEKARDKISHALRFAISGTESVRDSPSVKSDNTIESEDKALIGKRQRPSQQRDEVHYDRLVQDPAHCESSDLHVDMVNTKKMCTNSVHPPEFRRRRVEPILRSICHDDKSNSKQLRATPFLTDSVTSDGNSTYCSTDNIDMPAKSELPFMLVDNAVLSIDTFDICQQQRPRATEVSNTRDDNDICAFISEYSVSPSLNSRKDISNLYPNASLMPHPIDTTCQGYTDNTRINYGLALFDRFLNSPSNGKTSEDDK
jgi:hypothetical protein